MIALEKETQVQQVEDSQLKQLGEQWIHAIQAGSLDQLAGLCLPQITSFLLTPRRMTNLENSTDLVAKYHDWFDGYTDFQLEHSRISQVGEKLGISYCFRLQQQGEWFTIEQQLYCTLKDGRVDRLHLLCSGFQPAGPTGMDEHATRVAAPHSGSQDPQSDDLLEFHSTSPDSGSTCALLTPMIKARLRLMQPGQILEVHVDDPDARGDIEAWSRMSGNALLKMVQDEGLRLRFFVQKK